MQGRKGGNIFMKFMKIYDKDSDREFFVNINSIIGLSLEPGFVKTKGMMERKIYKIRILFTSEDEILVGYFSNKNTANNVMLEIVKEIICLEQDKRVYYGIFTVPNER